MADADLESSLPTQIGPVRFDRHSLATGDVPPSGFDDDLGRLLLRVAGSPDGELAVAWIEPVPEQSKAVGGMTVVAVRIRGSEARRLRVLPLIDRMLEPGTTGSFGGSEVGPPLLFAVDRLTMSAGEVLYIVTYPVDDPSATPDPNQTPEISPEALGAAFPGLDAVRLPQPESPDPTFPPDPELPDASLEPDLALEARLPDALRGLPLDKISAHGDSVQDSHFAMLAFPVYALWLGGLTLPLDDLSVAVAHSDALSSYVVIASSTGTHDPRETLGAWFSALAGNRIVQFETLESSGRLAILESGTAVAASEDTFYWMDYFDVGEFGPSPPPRPAIRDLVLETLKALP